MCLGLKWCVNHGVKHSMIGILSNQNLLRFQDENSLTGPGGDVTMTFQAFTTRQSDTYRVWAGLSEKLSPVLTVCKPVLLPTSLISWWNDAGHPDQTFLRKMQENKNLRSVSRNGSDGKWESPKWFWLLATIKFSSSGLTENNSHI